MDRTIDWDNVGKNARRNNAHASTVEFLTSQLWIDEMNDALAQMESSGVEIIELDSMDNTQTSSEDPYENAQNFSHAWSYANNRFQELENSYKANRQARLKRRLTNKNRNITGNESFDSEFDDSFYFNTPDYKNTTTDSEDVVKLNKQTNCFTILNKRSALKLDSSSEESDDNAKATKCGDIVLESGQNIDEVNYSSDLEEKHTIWIYSFKNRSLLSENDFEINVPCPSASSSCSPEHVDEEVNTDNTSHVGRVASPIPKSCIPRLNLTLTNNLPNVSEVSEPKSSPSIPKGTHPVTSKTFNGWFLDTETPEFVCKQDKSTSIVNWMALSPRERRRRSRHTHLDIQNITQLMPVSEIDSKTEVQGENSDENTKNTETNLDVKAAQDNSQRSKSDQQTEPAVECSMEDRGDYKGVGQRPHITFNRKQLVGSPITEPLDKLDCNTWIAEEEPNPRHEFERPGDDENQRARGDMGLATAGDRLMFRNMSLLKPAEWREYSPIAASHLSLEISLGPDSDTERTGFFQRCFNCFKCCKKKY